MGFRELMKDRGDGGVGGSRGACVGQRGGWTREVISAYPSISSMRLHGDRNPFFFKDLF